MISSLLKYLLFILLALGLLSCNIRKKESILIEKGKTIDFPSLQIKYVATDFSNLPNWNNQKFNLSLKSFKNSCSKLIVDDNWKTICQKAFNLNENNITEIKKFFEINFTPWVVLYKNNNQGIATGYYEPLIHGSRQYSSQYRFPIYSVPDDLISVPINKNTGTVKINLIGKNNGIISSNGKYKANLNNFYIDNNTRAIKGRIEGKNFIPYFTRGEINAGAINNKAKVIAYAKNPIDLFFLQVQGSGRLLTDKNEYIKLSFADKNGHPYKSIATYMSKQNYLPLSSINANNIKDWLAKNPRKLSEILSKNPSYIFFKINDKETIEEGPIGALGVPLTPEYSAAIDKRYIKMGCPIFITTIDPRNGSKLDRLIMAQDVGSAITGGIRVDLFWGYGDDAGKIAGKMKHPISIWVLFPKGVYPKIND